MFSHLFVAGFGVWLVSTTLSPNELAVLLLEPSFDKGLLPQLAVVLGIVEALLDGEGHEVVEGGVTDFLALRLVGKEPGRILCGHVRDARQFCHPGLLP